MNPITATQIGSMLDSGKLAVGAGQSSTSSASPLGFGNIFRAAAQQVHTLDAKAQSATLGVLSGDGVEVHEAMIATQKADLAFQLVLQVRNKAVAAYQQMMQMQF